MTQSKNGSISWKDNVKVYLDDYNSDLNFVIEEDGLTGSCLHKDGFEFIWAGARATHGVSRGKVKFSTFILYFN